MPGHVRDLRKRKTQPYTGPKPYQARWRHPDDPRVRRERSFAAPREAREWLEAQGTDSKRGVWIDPNQGRETFGLVAAEWQASRIKQGPRTRGGHDSILNAHILPVFGNRRIVGIDARTLDEWVQELAKTLAPNTVHNVFAVMRLVMAFAVRRRYIAVSPCGDVELPSKANDEEPEALTDEEVHKLANAMPTDRDRVAILVAAYCGPRANELWAFKPSDFTWRKLDDGALIYELLIDEALKEVTSKQPTPSDHERLTPRLLIGPTKTHARRRLTVLEPVAVELAAIIDPSKPFIFMEDGEPIRHNDWYKHVFTPTARAVFPERVPAAEQRATKRALDRGKPEPTAKQLERVSPITFHVLRHTCASIIIDEGRSQQHSRDIIAFDIMRYLGHKDIRTTFNIYAHWLAGAQEALAASLAARYRATAAGTAARAVLPLSG